MAKKFRKIYLVVEDGFIFNKSNYMSAEMYQDITTAERICKLKQGKAITDSQLMWNKGKPIPKYKVHPYYLIHSELF